jgi:IS5 family transposase
VVYRNREYFGAKSKGYDATMKKAIKESHLGVSDVLRNKRTISKKKIKETSLCSN